MGEDEEDADACCDQRKNAGEEEAEVVEGKAFPQRFLVTNGLMLQRAIADCHNRGGCWEGVVRTAALGDSCVVGWARRCARGTSI
jgi:hypothetical protein